MPSNRDASPNPPYVRIDSWHHPPCPTHNRGRPYNGSSGANSSTAVDSSVVARHRCSVLVRFAAGVLVLHVVSGGKLLIHARSLVGCRRLDSSSLTRALHERLAFLVES